ncbi:MAG: hypothetical protein IPJ87_10705 [Flavobacteriales bacterium]|nr:hypothetical protein [Flavobacteriales bacterium]MBK7942324.1 hypothetical protein [Flavobacteriales bacterium]MBK9699274.1 hypothetical protein [Flavobacteriales bacterium]
MPALHPLLRDGLAILLATVGVLSIALVNGYPLVYADTGTYLASAFEGLVPLDRPFWYGAFIRGLSFGGATLWPVVVVQALLCAIAVWRIARLLLPARTAATATVVSCVALGPFTGLGWTAVQLMPDILTAVGAVSIVLLVLQRERWPWRTYDFALVILACWCHLSNLVILPLVAVVAVLFTPRPRRQVILQAVSVTVCAWCGLFAANGLLTGTPHVSRGSHVFLMGRLVDAGLLRPWLQEHCTTEHYGLCAYLDSIPTTSRAFLWYPESPLQRQGGWEVTRAEYGRIVWGTLTEPKYLWGHVRASLVSTAEQLRATALADGVVSPWFGDPSTPPYQRVEQHVPHELPAFRSTWQSTARGRVPTAVFDAVHALLLALSAIGGLVVLSRRRTAPVVRAAVLLAFAVVLIGAWACASLSVVDARYLARDAWLLPVVVGLGVWAPRSEVGPTSAKC